MHRLRHILTLIVATLCAAALHGQEAQVQRFYLDPTDLEGQVHERLDGNGDRCALIKVQSAIPCEFNGDIVGDVVKKKGTYRVYVCAKDNFTRSIDIIPQGYLPMTVTFADFGIDEIKGGQTFVLRIETMTPVDSNRAKDEGANYLVLNIIPKQGATVRIDGNLTTVRDGSVTKFLKYGTHTYQVEAEGYETLTGEVEITPNGKTIKDVALKSLMATLTVLPQTQGCKISIDGEMKGSGHWTGKLSPGMYRIECSKQGYRSYATSVELAKSEFREVKIPALTPSYGNLNVNFTPAGATVEIDGKQMGSTPDVFRDIHAGKHEITISKQGFVTQTKTVNIIEGETAELNGGLVEKPKTDNDSVLLPINDDKFILSRHIESDTIYSYDDVDVKPQYPGGEEALKRWIDKNKKVYPPIKYQYSDSIRLEFMIDDFGRVGEVRAVSHFLIAPDSKKEYILRKLEKSAIKLLQALPKFKPGLKNGRPVCVWYPLTIRYINTQY